MRDDEAARRESFNRLVDEGIYSEQFDHPRALKDFVAKVLSERGLHPLGNEPMRVLDCGCGPGVWLAFLADRLEDAASTVDCYGFDLSDRMVELAGDRLSDRTGSIAIKQGDLLSPASYHFPDAADGFDLVFAFDVVQQLPPELQYAALQRVINSLRPGGAALIFDHDCASEYGRRMARKKFLTKYLHIPLVPRYYCDARYPPLSVFKEKIDAMPGVRATLVTDQATPKMALIVWNEKES